MYIVHIYRRRKPSWSSPPQINKLGPRSIEKKADGWGLRSIGGEGGATDPSNIPSIDYLQTESSLLMMQIMLLLLALDSWRAVSSCFPFQGGDQAIIVRCPVKHSWQYCTLCVVYTEWSRGKRRRLLQSPHLMERGNVFLFNCFAGGVSSFQ
jgi:hypothetical protein